jgi:hypothetical protein
VSLPTQYNGKNQDPVGALSSALARLQANKPLRELREVAKGITKQLPQPIQVATSKIDEYARGMISGSGSTLFEELGLYYIGPVDGHNMDDLVAVLQEVRSADTGEAGGRGLQRVGGWVGGVAGRSTKMPSSSGGEHLGVWLCSAVGAPSLGHHGACSGPCWCCDSCTHRHQLLQRHTCCW